MSMGMHLSKNFPYSASMRSCKILNRMAARQFDHLCMATEERVEEVVRSTLACT